MESNVPLKTEFAKSYFETNERFQKQRNIDAEDSKFYRMRKNKFGQPQRLTEDGLNAFLSSYQGEGVGTSTEKICEQNLTYSDLALLTDEDLELIGFKFNNERESLLKYFAELPNQDATYEELCNHPDAEGYNRQIIKKGARHLETMNRALVGAHYKLQLNMPDDVLVGEQYFASRFVADALGEVNKATHEIEEELDELCKVLDSQAKKKSRQSQLIWFIFIATSSLSAIFAFWYLKHRQ